MDEAILLHTTWSEIYWNFSQSAPYPKKSYKSIKNWGILSSHCPIPGLGIYSNIKNKDMTYLNFVYILIKGMDYDSKTLEPRFDFEVIKISNHSSKLILAQLPQPNHNLFSTIEFNSLINILIKIGENPPKEWLSFFNKTNIFYSNKDLAIVGDKNANWRNFIGNYFNEIFESDLSNNEFEDRIALLLTGLGFTVIKKGHNIIGDYPDGIAFYENYGLVYDCKNRIGYYPNASDERAINKYLDDEKKIHSNKNLFPVFIAKSFNYNNIIIPHYTVDTLNYLLYKKLILGSDFILNPIKKLLSNNSNLTSVIIDNEWLK